MKKAYLIVRTLGGIGDMLMLTPTFKAIKNENKDVSLVVCTTKQYGFGGLIEVLKNNPYVDDIITVDDVVKLRKYKFEKIYNFVSGYEVDIETETSKSRVDIFADLAEVKLKDKKPVYVITEDEIKWAKDFLKAFNGLKKVGINIWAMDEMRCWRGWKELVYLLASRNDIAVILFDKLIGEKNELIDEWFKKYKNVAIIRNLDLRKVAAILSQLNIFITVDSGLLHVAGALDVPVLALFGPTPASARISCYSTVCYINSGFCKPCWYNYCGKNSCMEYIEVSDVMIKTEKYIGNAQEKMTDILIIDFDGIGDLLMLTPTLEYFWRNGRKIDLIVRPTFKEIFKGLPYIRNIWDNVGDVFGKYGTVIDVTHKLSNYENKICRQHRIIATARICGIDKIARSEPEIRLDEDEILKAVSKFEIDKLKGNKVVIHVESNDCRRAYPKNKVEKLVGLLKEFGFSVIVVGTDKSYNVGNEVLDLRERTTVREVFALVKICDLVVCVDSFVLHVAGAFKKPAILFASTIPPEWRMYNGMIALEPIVGCYPCIDRGGDCRAKREEGWCIGTVSEDRFRIAVLSHLKKFKN